MLETGKLSKKKGGELTIKLEKWRRRGRVSLAIVQFNTRKTTFYN
jgi:hypothetical protein